MAKKSERQAALTAKKTTNTKQPAATPAVKATLKKPAKKPAADKTLSQRHQSVIDYLFKHDATTAANAIKREKVWEACGVGMTVIATLKSKGLMERLDMEDGSKLYRLTAEGKKLASK